MSFRICKYLFCSIRELIIYYRLKLECKLLITELSQEASPKESAQLKLMKVSTDSIKVSHLSGWDKSHTPWWSSLLSKTQSKLSISTYSLLARKIIQRTPNYWLLSYLVTGLVSSALLYLTQLIQWSQSSTREIAMHQLDNKLKKFTEISDSRDSGTDSEPELLWLVPSPVSNGGSMTPSRLPVVFKQPVVNEDLI